MYTYIYTYVYILLLIFCFCCLCVCIHIYVFLMLFCVLFLIMVCSFICLFVFKREKEGVELMGKEMERIWEEVTEGKLIRMYQMGKNFNLKGGCHTKIAVQMRKSCLGLTGCALACLPHAFNEPPPEASSLPGLRNPAFLVDSLKHSVSDSPQASLLPPFLSFLKNHQHRKEPVAVSLPASTSQLLPHFPAPLNSNSGGA